MSIMPNQFCKVLVFAIWDCSIYIPAIIIDNHYKDITTFKFNFESAYLFSAYEA